MRGDSIVASASIRPEPLKVVSEVERLLRASLLETLIIALAYGPDGRSPPDEEAVFARAKAILGLPAGWGRVGVAADEEAAHAR